MKNHTHGLELTWSSKEVNLQRSTSLEEFIFNSADSCEKNVIQQNKEGGREMWL
jgi:hypothetical protein